MIVRADKLWLGDRIAGHPGYVNKLWMPRKVVKWTPELRLEVVVYFSEGKSLLKHADDQVNVTGNKEHEYYF